MIRRNRLFSIVVMILLSVLVLISFRVYQDWAPGFEDIASFDPSHYDFTYSLQEFNTYEITNYDRHGNETRIWIEGKCFLKTDANGYLQMIVQDNPGTYSVLRVDDSGKPLWTAVYHKETLSLMEYSVCCYQEIDG